MNACNDDELQIGIESNRNAVVLTFPFLNTFTLSPIVGTVSTGSPWARTDRSVVLPLGVGMKSKEQKRRELE